MKEKNILVVGPIYVDSIYTGLPQAPEIGKEVYGQEFVITIGGMGITAIGLKRLGINVEILTVVGDDLQGEFLKDRLKAEGIKTNKVITLKGKPTSNSTAMVFNGDRGFISYQGAELKISQLLKNRLHSKNLALNIYDHLHMSMGGDDNLLKILRGIKQNNITTSLVTGWDGALEYAGKKAEFRKLLKYTDYFFCNQTEARKLTGFADPTKALHQLAESTCPVITLGSEGAITIDEKNMTVKASALEVDFVDPTGAGDSLIAGFLAGLLRNWPRKRSLQLGTICGSLSTRALGGATVFPQFIEAKAYLTEE